MADSLRSDFYLGDWRVSPELNRIERDGERAALQPLSMQILVHLAECAGSVVENDALLARFWPNGVATDEAVHRRIADIRSKLGDQARDPSYIETIHKKGYRCIARVSPVSPATRKVSPRGRRWLAPALVATVFVLILLGFRPDDGPAKGDALAAFADLVAEDRYTDAYLAVEPYLDELRAQPEMGQVLDEVTRRISLHTNVDPANIRYRLVGTDRWLSLDGLNDEETRLPRGVIELQVEKPGYQTATLIEPNPGIRFNNVGRPHYVIRLIADSEAREGMVFVPGGSHRLGVWGVEFPVDVGDFLIDAHEVTNAEYAAFVDAGGYENPKYWPGGVIPGFVEQFVDTTGRPGPSGWEFGRYPTGQADHPVSGVSWYEAQAYAHFRGKSLPSIYHWARAALAHVEWKWPIASAVVPRANLSGSGLLSTRTGTVREAHGTQHMIGNVQEWTRTAWEERRFVIGGSWKDPRWRYNVPVALSPVERTPESGFRCIVELEQTALPSPGPIWATGATADPGITREAFDAVARGFDYPAGSVRAADATRVSTDDQGHWLRKVVLLPGDKPDDPLPVYIYQPKTTAAPMQAVIFMPPADSFGPSLKSDAIDIADYQLDFVPLSGRALIWPTYLGTHERYQAFSDKTPAEKIRLTNERLWTRRKEVGQIIDYLTDHPEYDGSRVALMGLSMGASYTSAQILAFEPRLKAAVLYAVGIVPATPVVLPEFHSTVYWPLVRQPVLLANGRWDVNRPPELVFHSLVDLIGTPSEHKRAILYEGASHWPLPRRTMMRDTTQWLNEQFGPAAP